VPCILEMCWTEDAYFECEMFQEMSGSGGSICFGTRSGIDPDTNCSGLKIRRILCGYRKTITKSCGFSGTDERVGGCSERPSEDGDGGSKLRTD